MSQSAIARAEAGHFDSLSLRTLRRVTATLDIRLDFDARWRGGELDRLLDSRHAMIGAVATAQLVAAGWRTLQEVTYAIYRERGSIDVLGLKVDIAAAAILEIKSEVTSWEEAQRKFDEKVRLLPKITFEREGWRPRLIGRILVLDDTTTNRRRIHQVGPGVDQSYPARTREVRTWIKEPTGPLAGLWFLPSIHAQGRRQGAGGFHRVRKAKSG